MTNKAKKVYDDNRDPISGAPGSHPIGTGVGAASAGALAGAAIGTVAGPGGAAVGATLGAIAGGLVGKGVAEAINPTSEDAYWRAQFDKEPYYERIYTYDDYAPAYRIGYDAYGRYRGRTFDDVSAQLEREYNANRGTSRLNWDKAKHAMRAAWNRVERALPGDADCDGI
jgi:uncharacterized protein YcfJ